MKLLTSVIYYFRKKVIQHYDKNYFDEMLNDKSIVHIIANLQQVYLY